VGLAADLLECTILQVRSVDGMWRGSMTPGRRRALSTSPRLNCDLVLDQAVFTPGHCMCVCVCVTKPAHAWLLNACAALVCATSALPRPVPCDHGITLLLTLLRAAGVPMRSVGC
jgi:hypothetical protein